MYNGPVFEADMSVQINKDLRVRGELQLDNSLPLATDDTNGMLSSDLHKKITNIDTAPIKDSQNLVSSGGTYSALDNKADKSNTYNKTEVDGVIKTNTDALEILIKDTAGDVAFSDDTVNMFDNYVSNAFGAGGHLSDEVATKAYIDQKLAGLTALVAYPIGSLYWSSNPTSPATLFGGTWAPIQDTFVYAAPSSNSGDPAASGTTYQSWLHGEKTHIITTAEMPSHGNHLFIGNMYDPMATQNVSDESWIALGNGKYLSSTPFTTYATNNRGWKDWNGGEFYPSGMLEGGGIAHNNMPNHLIRYCWERTA